MEIFKPKRRKKRNRKYNLINKIQCLDHIKLQVRSSKLNTKQIISKNEKKINNIMEARTFWKNYKVAHEWQKKHNIIWWKTRCFALEYENYILKENIKNFILDKNSENNSLEKCSKRQHTKNIHISENGNVDDNIEFHMNEDMIDFITQSIKHKIELKNKNGIISVENKCKKKNKICNKIYQRNEDAKLLYGKGCSGILAMETALHTTIERHIYKTKPQYWPNIPLKLCCYAYK